SRSLPSGDRPGRALPPACGPGPPAAPSRAPSRPCATHPSDGCWPVCIRGCTAPPMESRATLSACACNPQARAPSAPCRGPADTRSPRTRRHWRTRGCRSRGSAGRCPGGRPYTRPCYRQVRRTAQPTSSAWGRRGSSLRSSMLFLGEQLIELAFESVIVEVVVQLGARLHGIDHAFLRSFAADRLIHVERGLVHRTERGKRVEHERHVDRAQLFDRE